MKLNEIRTGTEINVKAITKDRNSIEFNTEILDIIEKPVNAGYGCLVRLIREEGKVITFDNVSILVTLHNLDDGRDYQYSILAAPIINTEKYGRVYALFSRDDSLPINNRDAVRVPLFTSGTAIINNGEYSCYTRNISYGGIAISIDNSVSYNIGDYITIKFKGTDSNLNYRVSGTVVRDYAEERTGKILLGIEFNREFQEVKFLVNSIQLAERKTR